MSNELDDLFVDGKEIDKKLVADILSPYVKIDKNTCEIRPLKSWKDVKAYIKILIYLLARKAMVAWGLNIEEAALNSEIIRNTGLKKGTVHPAVRQLYNEKTIEQTKEHKYYIPNHAVEKVSSMINQGQN